MRTVLFYKSGGAGKKPQFVYFILDGCPQP